MITYLQASHILLHSSISSEPQGGELLHLSTPGSQVCSQPIVFSLLLPHLLLEPLKLAGCLAADNTEGQQDNWLGQVQQSARQSPAGKFVQASAELL
jgi:hypothetical protein